MLIGSIIAISFQFFKHLSKMGKLFDFPAEANINSDVVFYLFYFKCVLSQGHSSFLCLPINQAGIPTVN